MIWLSWRQFRTQVAVIAVAVAALGVALAITGPGILDAYHAQGHEFLSQLQFNKLDRFLYVLGLVTMYVAPPVVGAFWGAPLIARELEAGTHRLAWTQSVSRIHWLATKLLMTALAGLVAGGLLTLAVSWWSSPIDRAAGNGDGVGPFNLPRLDPTVFGARALAPIGYLVLALAVGVTLGFVLRRSVAAIALTLVVVAAVQVVVPLMVRSHLATTVTENIVISTETFTGIQASSAENGRPVGPLHNLVVKAGKPGDWMLTSQTVNAAGVVQRTLPSWLGACISLEPPGAPAQSPAPVNRDRSAMSACFTRLTDEGYHQRVTYQPASHFWTLQWRETSLLFAVSLLLFGFCFWRIRRDMS
ncbi:MAG: hypothetical protein JWO88_2580 [Frankiales bacterium]|nr:hypothetical protein [Frankiales bacterium]